MTTNVYRKNSNSRNTLQRRLKRLFGPRNRLLQGYLELRARPAAFIEEARSAIEICRDDWDIDFAFLDKNQP